MSHLSNNLLHLYQLHILSKKYTVIFHFLHVNILINILVRSDIAMCELEISMHVPQLKGGSSSLTLTCIESMVGCCMWCCYLSQHPEGNNPNQPTNPWYVPFYNPFMIPALICKYQWYIEFVHDIMAATSSILQVIVAYLTMGAEGWCKCKCCMLS